MVVGGRVVAMGKYVARRGGEVPRARMRKQILRVKVVLLCKIDAMR